MQTYSILHLFAILRLNSSSPDDRWRETLSRVLLFYFFQDIDMPVLWLYHMNFNETPREKSTWEQRQDAVCRFEHPKNISCMVTYLLSHKPSK